MKSVGFRCEVMRECVYTGTRAINFGTQPQTGEIHREMRAPRRGLRTPTRVPNLSKMSMLMRRLSRSRVRVPLPTPGLRSRLQELAWSTAWSTVHGC